MEEKEKKKEQAKAKFKNFFEGLIYVKGNDVLRSHSITGGKVPDSFGEASVCVAASHGDILKLRMLHEFGQKMHVCDYDDRFPLVCACACACARVRACL